MITDLFNEVPKVAVDARTDYVEEVMNGYFKSITEFGSLATGSVLIVRTKNNKEEYLSPQSSSFGGIRFSESAPHFAPEQVI